MTGTNFTTVTMILSYGSTLIILSVCERMWSNPLRWRRTRRKISHIDSEIKSPASGLMTNLDNRFVPDGLAVDASPPRQVPSSSYISAGPVYPFYRSYGSPRRKKVIVLSGKSRASKNVGRSSRSNEKTHEKIIASGYAPVSRSLLLLATCVICLAGGSWQLYTIFDNYLRYDIISEVYFDKEDSVIPPAFSLCLPYAELVNYTAVDKRFQEVDSNFWLAINSSRTRDEIAAKIQSELTVNNIFDFTPKLTDLMMSGYVRVPGSYRVNYDNLDNLEATKYVKDDLVCYEISYRGQSKDQSRGAEFSLKSHHITYGQEPGVHMIIRLFRRKIQHVSKAIMYLHPFGQLPRGDRDFPLNFITFDSSQLFANSSSYIGITYNKANLNLLKSPYSTDCKNFSNFHPPFAENVTFESEYHCVHYCMRVKTMDRFNLASFTTTFDRPRSFRIMTKYSIYTNSTLESEFDLIFNNCQKACPGKSCHQVFYMPALITTRESDDVVFVLYDMAGLETTANFQPKMGLVELLVQVLSVSGVWLGLSCVDIIMTFVQILARGSQRSFRRRKYSKI